MSRKLLKFQTPANSCKELDSNFEPGGREFESLRARHLLLTGHVVRICGSALGSQVQQPVAGVLIPAEFHHPVRLHRLIIRIRLQRGPVRVAKTYRGTSIRVDRIAEP